MEDELLHFQFFTYYTKEAERVLDPEQLDALKEGMTIIIDDEFSHITSVKDEGYDIHEEIRKEFLKIWRNLKDLDLFVKEATNFLLRNNL